MPSIITLRKTVVRVKRREEITINNANDLEILEIPEIYKKTLKACDLKIYCRSA